MLSVLLAIGLQAAAPVATPAPGVPETLARERAAAIRNLRYDLAFEIPADRTRPVRGHETVTLTLAAPHRLVLDFEQPRDRIASVRMRGADVPFELVNGHLVVAAGQTRAGENAIEIAFTAGDEALNRNDEFLYTLHVPARARYTFPCFDQPDLKGRYRLSLTVPEGWQVAANGAEVSRLGGAVSFAETPPLPTYLFSFVAGRFSIETARRDGRELRMFHRETDAAKVARNRDAIFDLHAAALAWMEDYTGIRYPWGKFDVVLIPSFQFSGMEHAGAILYNNSSLMLDESATQNQLLARATTISHETAHLWFGDLVTMRWFDDVWMKEVFAEFMANKIVNPSFPQVNHELRFLLGNYPTAYGVDRTEGTNPIRQPLANLTEAGQLYGPIIYQKAPIVMRQLELIAGADAFRDGLRDYLRQYSFGNATWPELVRLLDARTPENLTAWSRDWVEQRGRPTIRTSVRSAGSRLTSITLATSDGMNRGLVWPQRLKVALGYADRVDELPVYLNGRSVAVPGVRGRETPRFVLPNGGGLGYGMFVLDPESRRYLVEHIEEITDPLTRGSAWVTLWDNMLSGDVAPRALLDAAIRALPRETDELNTQRVLAYAVRAYWRFLPDEERLRLSPVLEPALRAGLARAGSASQKAAWFNAYRDTVRSEEGVAWLARVWRRDEPVPGLPLAEPDDITLAMELAVRGVTGWEDVLQAQLARTANPDRKARFAFVMPCLSNDAAVRLQAFERFRLLENRRREPWVQDCLFYLNHPLRDDSLRYVEPALELLREVQRTGDIFFPTNWMQNTLWGHRSPAAAAMVRGFLARQRDYPERLRWVILTAADELFRSSAAAAAPGRSAGVPAARRAP